MSKLREKRFSREKKWGPHESLGYGAESEPKKHGDGFQIVVGY